VFGKILSGTKAFIIAALITAAAVFAARGEGVVSAAGDSGSVKPAADSAKAKSNADTSVTTGGALPDSPAAARVGDTAAVSRAADTIAAADTLAADTPKIDTSAIKALAVTDTSTAAPGGVDTATTAAGKDSTILPDAEEKAKKPLLAGSKLFQWIAANIFYIVFFGVSILIVAAALYYFLTRKDARRFLTTTRLSVLDKMVQKGCRCIESNYADPNLSVDTVARELITGPAYLDALFVKEVGIDVHDFIAQVRVNSIKNILSENPSANMDDACSRSGFKNRSDADRYFKRLCKIEIAEYVNSLRG